MRKSIVETMRLWRQFCALDLRFKQLVPYKYYGGLGVGYEHKIAEGETLDRKEDLHFCAAGFRETLDYQINAYPDELSALKELRPHLELLGELLETVLIDFAINVEREFGVESLVEEVAEGRDHRLLRLLHYFGDAHSGEAIAKAHADKSGFTVTLAETTEGFEYLDGALQWHAIPSCVGETGLLIPGMQLQLRSRNEIKALYHRVCATHVSSEVGRYSMVCFVPLCRTPAYDKARAGRIQDAMPGFNYDMPFETFSELFA